MYIMLACISVSGAWIFASAQSSTQFTYVDRDTYTANSVYNFNYGGEVNMHCGSTGSSYDMVFLHINLTHRLENLVSARLVFFASEISSIRNIYINVVENSWDEYTLVDGYSVAQVSLVQDNIIVSNGRCSIDVTVAVASISEISFSIRSDSQPFINWCVTSREAADPSLRPGIEWTVNTLPTPVVVGIIVGIAIFGIVAALKLHSKYKTTSDSGPTPGRVDEVVYRRSK